MSDREFFSESYRAVASAVPKARSALTRFARELGVAEEDLENLRLIISEAVTNVVLHAYEGRVGDVHVTAALADGDLWVLVSDNGAGLRSRSDSPGLGLGLALIEQLASDLAIERGADGGTLLRMRFPVAEPRGARRPHISLLEGGGAARPGRNLRSVPSRR